MSTVFSKDFIPQYWGLSYNTFLKIWWARMFVVTVSDSNSDKQWTTARETARQQLTRPASNIYTIQQIVLYHFDCFTIFTTGLFFIFFFCQKLHSCATFEPKRNNSFEKCRAEASISINQMLSSWIICLFHWYSHRVIEPASQPTSQTATEWQRRGNHLFDKWAQQLRR